MRVDDIGFEPTASTV